MFRFLLLSIFCCYGNYYAKFWLSNLNDTLMLHACERFELHAFSSFREIKTNIFTLQIQLLINSHLIFGTNGESERSENDNFDFCEDSLSQI